jgi:flagellar motor switch/type III secretory pathway protein FliN
VSQKLRQDRVYGAAEEPDKPNTATSAGQAGQAIVTQQEIQNKLSQEVGLSNAQIEQLKKLGQDPAARAALLKSFGVQT